MTTYTASDRKRFYSKTKLSGPGCLEWTGYTDSKGYGKFYLAGKTFGIDRTTAFKIAKGTRWGHTC